MIWKNAVAQTLSTGAAPTVLQFAQVGVYHFSVDKYSSGQIARIVIFGYAMSDTERVDVQNLLNAQYALY